MTKPTFVFVPGAWHTPEIYAETIKNLESHGYSATGLPLPSVGAEPAHISFDGDVEGIRSCLTDLVEVGNEVILVSHSYTGMPATEAPKGLGRAERMKLGLPGGVTRLVYIMSFAMPEGFQPTAGGAQYPEWMKVDKERKIVTVSPEDANRLFYNDLPSDEGFKWSAKLQHQSEGVYHSTTTYAAWRDIPSTFIIGTEDKTTFTADVVDYMLNTARQQAPTAFDVVETCEGGGHCLMISHPQWLALAMRRAAGEKV